MIFNLLNRYPLQYGEGGTGSGGSGGSGGTGGGSTGGVDDPIINLPSDSQAIGSIRLVDSPYSFTDPPRYFKANDPYYYEVDNIPLKQIQENCLWLKDQVTGTSFNISGISKSKITDLQPFSNGKDRIVNVRPGNFIGRVNSVDTGNLGVVQGGTNTVDMSREQIFTPQGLAISNDVFRGLAGEQVTSILGLNGLDSHYSHHQARVTFDGSKLRFEPEGTFVADEGPINLETLTKVQSAAWQQVSNLSDSAGANAPGLRQLSVDFCRRWGGVFRTAVVNVTENLSLQVPEFSADDFMDNNQAYSPTVRIDLVFLYTYPVDATKSSPVTEVEGSQVKTITKPTLGLIKGAGGILRSRNEAVNIAQNPGNIGGENWTSQADPANRNKYYDTSGSLEGDAALSQIAALTDQVNTLAESSYGFPDAATYDFPSPDDLLNLAPLLAEEVLDTNLASVGQSILPLCYVVVKEGSSVITDDDIIDIRPFMRTAELTYNERSGLGAANPPVSIANPVVSKQELYNSLQLMRNYIVDFFGTETTTNSYDIQKTEYFSVQQPIFENISPGAINQGGTNASYEFTLPLPTNINYSRVVACHFRIRGYSGDGDYSAAFISQGEGIVDERIIMEIAGNGDDDRSERTSPNSFIYPAKISANNDSLTITMRGEGAAKNRFWLYVDAVDYLESITITNTTVGG